MQAAKTGKRRVYLRVPGYRRWLTPDMGEITLELSGFTGADLRTTQLRALTTDFESGSTGQRLFLLDETSPFFVMPAPRLHASGQLEVQVEDARTGRALAEETWQLSGIGREQLPQLAYFDERRVLFVQGNAAPPLAWHPTETDCPPARLERARALGFSVAVLPTPVSPDQVAHRAGLADKLGLQLLVSPFASMEPGLATLANARDHLRALRALPALLGYWLPATGWRPTDLVELYRVARAADAGRLCVLPVPSPLEADSWREFFDVVALAPKASNQEYLTAHRLGTPVFARLGTTGDEARPEDWLRQRRREFYEALAHGAAGFVWHGPDTILMKPPCAALLREASAIVQLLRRGRVIPLDTVQQEELLQRQLQLWQLRFGEEYVLAALYHGNATRTLTFPVPRVAQLKVLRESRQLTPREGFLTDSFEPGGFHVYAHSTTLSHAAP